MISWAARFVAARGLEGIAAPGVDRSHGGRHRQVKGRLDLAVMISARSRLGEHRRAGPCLIRSEVVQPAQAETGVRDRSACGQIRECDDLAQTARLRYPGLAATLALALLAVWGLCLACGHTRRVPRDRFRRRQGASQCAALFRSLKAFENLSGYGHEEYFADGLTDDLTTDLSHLPDSFVDRWQHGPSPTSASRST